MPYLSYDADLARAVAEDVVKVRPHGFGITATEFGELINISIKTAKKILMEKVKLGELEYMPMRFGKHISVVYYRPGENKSQKNA